MGNRSIERRLAQEAMGRHGALVERLRAALRLLDSQDITPAGRRVLERILDAEADRQVPDTMECFNCGDTTRIKASASRAGETRYFCHDSEQSCYNDCRGRYFDDIPGPEAYGLHP